MKVLAILFISQYDCFRWKRGEQDGYRGRFPKESRAPQKGGTLLVVKKSTQRSKCILGGGGKKGTREGREEKGMSACFQPDQSLHQLLPMCSSVSEKGFQREYECVCVRELFSLLSWSMWEEWVAQRELLISVLLLWANSEILEAALDKYEYLSYSSFLNGKSLSIDMWIKETKHVKVPEPNPGDWYLLLVVNYLILPTLPLLCQILLVTQVVPRIFASLVWVWMWHLKPGSNLWRIHI